MRVAGHGRCTHRQRPNPGDRQALAAVAVPVCLPHFSENGLVTGRRPADSLGPVVDQRGD